MSNGNKINGEFINCTENILVIGHVILMPGDKIRLYPDMEDDVKWKYVYRDAAEALEKKRISVVSDVVAPNTTIEEDNKEQEKIVLSRRARVGISEEEAEAFVNQHWKVLEKAIKDVNNMDELNVYLDAALRLGKSDAVVNLIQRRINQITS